MKKIFTLFMLTVLTVGLYSQELDSLKAIMDKKDAPAKAEILDDDPVTNMIVDDDGDVVRIKLMEKEVVRVIEDGDTTYVKVGEKGIIEVTDQPDSTSIRVGDKEIRIVERDNDTEFHFGDVDDDEEISNPKFRGHWAGFEWGINNFLDDELTISREGNDQFMDLNTGRSWVINLNVAQYSIGFGTSHVGLITGLGLEFNNYFFDHENSVIEIDDYLSEDTLGANVEKSKLTSTFLRIPLILEVQFPKTIRAKRIHISAGIVAGLKLGSHTKVLYKEDGKRTKDKDNDDFNISPFRYGLTARIGYGNLSVFSDYYLTPMFVDDKGPDLHPFSVGLALAF